MFAKVSIKFFIAFFLLQFFFITPPKIFAAEIYTLDNNFANNQTLIEYESNSLNSAIFSTPIVYYNNNIYTCYVDSSLNVIVAKSTTNGTSWSQTTIATGNTDDSHNICSLGIDSSGFIHVSYDIHAAPLKYKVSAASESIASFGNGTMTGTAETAVAYPNFYKSPSNELYFLYRDGASGNGDLYIKKYNSTTTTWSDFAAPLIDGKNASPTVNPYWFTLVWDSEENMQIFWNWRQTGAGGGANNIDILYARYDKAQSRWEKSDGTAYSLPITKTTAEVAASISAGSGLSNTNSNYVDTNNLPHAAYIKFAPDGHSEVFHTYHNGSTWVTTQATDLNTTISGRSWDLSRPQILIDSSNTIYIFFANGGQSSAANFILPPGTLYWTKSTDNGSTWSTPAAVTLAERGSEFVPDLKYFRDTGKIRFFFQTTESSTAPLYILEGTNIINGSYNNASYTSAIDSSQVPIGTLTLENISNLMGFWKLEETSGSPQDSSSNGFSGTIIGSGLTRGVAGHSSGNAYQFDGASAIEIADNSLLDFGTTTDFTLQAWFKTTSSNSQAIVSKYDAGATAGYMLYMVAGKINAFLRDGTGSPDTTTISGSTTVNDGAWHHAAAVFDRDGNLSLYIDGQSDATPVAITVTDTISNAKNVGIGTRDSNTLPQFFTGTIDEVTIHNKALSTSEFNYPSDYSLPNVAYVYSTGSYTGPYTQWSAPVTYNNITIDATLNSGSATATVQTSANRFSTVENSYDITVLDGSHIYSLPISGNLYARVLFTLTPASGAGITPTINSLTLSADLATTASTSTASSSSPSSSSSVCNETAPTNLPQLLYAAIPQNPSQILLYFSDAQGSVDHYAIQYGLASNKYIYGQDNIGKYGIRTFLVQSLLPNTTYYFRVRAGNGCATGPWSNEISTTTSKKTSTNNIVSSELKPTASTKQIKENESISKGGYQLNIKVTDTQNKPLKGVKVILHSTPQETVTDENGIAKFSDVEEGEHSVIIEHNNSQGEQKINLTGEVKQYDLNIQIKPTNPLADPRVLGGFAILSVVIVLLTVLLLKRRLN